MNTTKAVFIVIPAIALLAGCQAGGSSASSSSSSSPSASTSGGSGSTTSSSSGSGGTLTAPDCSALPASTVESALGITGLGAPQETKKSGGVGCTYEGKSLTSGLVSITMIPGFSATALNAGKNALTAKGTPVKPYPGVGDEAYSVTIGTGSVSQNLLVALKDGLEVTIQSGGPLSGEANLATQVFAKG